MSIQLIRENIEVERISGEGSVQALIEGSVMLPSPARDAAPLYADARLEMGNVEVQADRVALDGQAYFTLVYTAGEDGQVRSVETALNFSHILNVPDARPKMGVEVQGNIEHVEAEIIGGKALLRAVAGLRARAQIKRNIACITDIEGVESLQKLSATTQSLRTLARGEKRVSLDERFELPFGLESTETLFGQAYVQVDEVTPQKDRIDVAGTVHVDAFHKTTMFDRPIARTKHSLPFAASIDATGCEAGLSAQADTEVRDLMLTLDQTEEEKYLNISMTLAAKARAQEVFTATTIADAYAASDDVLSLKSEKMLVRTGIKGEKGEDSIKAVMTVDAEKPPMAVVLAAFARPAMWELASDSRTHVEGVLEATIVYNPANGERPAVVTDEIPFRASFEFPLPEDSWSTLTVTDTEAIQITGDRLELKCSLILEARIYEHEELNIATDAEMAEESKPIPGGVTLYFVQPGDTLWSVAKQFRTTRESLTRFNPEIDELSGNERILLYKRVTNV